MKTHANQILTRSATLLAAACLAGLGVTSPASGQDEKPARSSQAQQEEARRQRAMPVHKPLPNVSLTELTETEEEVGVQRPINQRHIQVIYVFSCADVEDNTWVERLLATEEPGVRSTLEHMQRLAELETFEGRVLWSAIAVPASGTTSTLPAGYAGADDPAQVDRKVKPAEQVSPARRAARALAHREFLRKLKDQTDAEFPFLLDVENRVVAALGLRSNAVLVVDARGVIQFAADEQHTMLVGDESEDIADSDYLRRALNELLDGNAEVSAPYGIQPRLPRAPR